MNNGHQSQGVPTSENAKAQRRKSYAIPTGVVTLRSAVYNQRRELVLDGRRGS
jgi:acyl dehydratase